MSQKHLAGINTEFLPLGHWRIWLQAKRDAWEAHVFRSPDETEPSALYRYESREKVLDSIWIDLCLDCARLGLPMPIIEEAA